MTGPGIMDPLAAIRDTFFQECEEQLTALEEGLLTMQAGAADADTVNAVFRAVHSIKGGAGAFGLDELVKFAHVFESALDGVRAGQIALDSAGHAALLHAADLLADLVHAAKNDGALELTRCARIAEELAALGHAAPAPTPGTADDGMDDLGFQPLAAMFEEFAASASIEHTWTVAFTPRREMYAKANDAALLLRELARLGTLSAIRITGELPTLAVLDPEDAYLGWSAELRTEASQDAIQEVFEFVEGDCEVCIAPVETAPSTAGVDVATLLEQVQGAPEPAVPEEGANPVAERGGQAQAAPATIRVELDRVDRLIDLVGELVINQAMLSQRIVGAGLPRVSTIAIGLGDVEQLTREIQDSVMAIRAQPVKSVFQRMARLVREVAAQTGKMVRLATDGEATEVDRTVIERLADPLTHMIRNAIDHGIEDPDTREAAGKPRTGTVNLSARHRSGRIVIEVADDGAGISRARVRSVAVRKGLLAADAVLSDDETDQLIFLPGFSTAATVSDISGRGVGMDVVRRSIQLLGGRISIASQPGQGSTFILSLPLTLAVLDGMVVSAGGEMLVVPMTHIVQSFKPKPGDVRWLGADARAILMRGSFVPVIDVGAVLGYGSGLPDPEAGVGILVEGEGGTRAALMFNEIHGPRQVVIKSLEANYRHVDGIAAATILGDGRVALILDVDSTVAAARITEPGRAAPLLVPAG